MVAQANSPETPSQEAKRNLFTVFIDHFNKQAAIDRAAAATGFGLNPTEFARPYPGSAVTQNLAQTSSPANMIATVLLSLLAGGGITSAVMSYLTKPTAPAVAPVAPAPKEYKVTFTTEDGKPITVEPSK